MPWTTNRLRANVLRPPVLIFTRMCEECIPGNCDQIRETWQNFSRKSQAWRRRSVTGRLAPKLYVLKFPTGTTQAVFPTITHQIKRSDKTSQQRNLPSSSRAFQPPPISISISFINMFRRLITTTTPLTRSVKASTIAPIQSGLTKRFYHEKDMFLHNLHLLSKS